MDEIPQKVLDEAKRLKSYFPFREIFVLVYPDGEIEALAPKNRRWINMQLRTGAKVFQITQE